MKIEKVKIDKPIQGSIKASLDSSFNLSVIDVQQMNEDTTLEFKPCYVDSVLKLESLDPEGHKINEHKFNLLFFAHGIVYNQEIKLFNEALFKITIHVTKEGEEAFVKREKSIEEKHFKDMAKHLRDEITRMRNEKLNHREKINPQDYEVDPKSVEVIDEIAEWKYGEVYLAKKKNFSLIKKTITLDEGFGENMEKLLLDEVKKLTSICFYSGLMEFYGYNLQTDTESAALFYFCERETFQYLTLDYLIKNRIYLDVNTKVKMIIRICVGLSQLKKELCINPINPANIYIDKNNQFFIGDYEQYMQTKRENLFIPPEINDSLQQLAPPRLFIWIHSLCD